MEVCVMFIKFVVFFCNNNYKKKFFGNICIKMLKFNKFFGLLFYFLIDKFWYELVIVYFIKKW